jgi:hypothetical protein
MMGARGFIRHLAESMDDCGVKAVFVDEVSLKIGVEVEGFWTERAVMAAGESAEKLVILEVMGKRSGEVAIIALER